MDTPMILQVVVLVMMDQKTNVVTVMVQVWKKILIMFGVVILTQLLMGWITVVSVVEIIIMKIV
jgi:hypothetical protein